MKKPPFSLLLIVLVICLLAAGYVAFQKKAPESENQEILSLASSPPPLDSDGLRTVVIAPDARLEVQCDANALRTTKEWRVETGALMAINAGYFDESNAMIGGTLTTTGIEGSVGQYPAVMLRSEIRRTGDIDVVATDFYLESFPILVENGVRNFARETSKFARRTIIAERNGVMTFVFSVRRVSLYEIANQLADAGYEAALNLDGGPSTGFSSDKYEILSVPIPCVILVF